jgi:hypothetical protein
MKGVRSDSTPCARDLHPFQLGPGPVSEDLDERYMTNPDFAGSILLKPAVAHFLVITKVRGGQTQSHQRVLESVVLKPPQHS